MIKVGDKTTELFPSAANYYSSVHKSLQGTPCYSFLESLIQHVALCALMHSLRHTCLLNASKSCTSMEDSHVLAVKLAMFWGRFGRE